MSKLKCRRFNVKNSGKKKHIQEISFLYVQLEDRERECQELKHQCALLRSENCAMAQQLEAIYGIVFRQK